MTKMLFLVGYLASLPSLLTASPVVARDSWPYPDNCVYDFMTNPPDRSLWTGGLQQDVNLHCVSGWANGHLITGLTTWTQGTDVRGIQVQYSDGSKSDVIGLMDGDQAQGNWDMSDAIVSAQAWGNGVHYRVGQLAVTTKSGTNVRVGDGRTDGAVSYDTGSGLLAGLIVATAANGGEVVRAGFLFIKDIISEVKVTDFVFDDDLDTLNSQHRGISVSVLDQATYHNARKNDTGTFNFINSVERQHSHTISQENQNQIGVGYTLSFEASILDLAKVSSSLSLSYQYTEIHTSETTNTETVTLSWEASDNVVQPGKSVFCNATAMSGEFDGGYTSKIQITLNGGQSFTFDSRGRLSATGWSDGFASCEDVEEPPPGVRVVNV